MQRGRYITLATMAGVLALAGWPARPVSAAPPAGFTAMDIGGPGAPGSTDVQADGSIVQKGSGADIWGTNDQFQYCYQKLTGDGSIEAELLKQDPGTSTSTCCVKSGVMIRETTADDSAHVNLAQNDDPTRNVLWEYRPRTSDSNGSQGGTANPGYLKPQVFPVTLRLERRGDYLYGWGSQDGGKTYQRVGYPVTLDGIGPDVLAGLATTAHDDGDVSISTFDKVKVGPDLLPDPINIQLDPRDKSVIVTWDSAAGTDVTFNVYARVAPPPTDNPGAGPPTDQTWVKVNDQPVSGRSYVVGGLTDGTSYDFAVAAVVGGVERSQQLPEPKTLNNAVNLVGPATPQVPMTIGGIDNWTVHNIGTRDPGKAAVDAKGVITMNAGGTDAWDTTDGLSYLAVPIQGDFTATARIVSGPTAGAGTDGWTNGGLMVRETLDPSSRFAMTQIAENNPLQFKKRMVAGRTPENVTLNGLDTTTFNTMRPVWFQLQRKGDVFTAQYSYDNTADPTKVKWVPMSNDQGGDTGPNTATITGFSKNAWVGFQLNGRGEGSGMYSQMVVDNVAITKG